MYFERSISTNSINVIKWGGYNKINLTLFSDKSTPTPIKKITMEIDPNQILLYVHVLVFKVRYTL